MAFPRVANRSTGTSPPAPTNKSSFSAPTVIPSPCIGANGEGATGFAWNNPERLLWYPDEDLREIITACFASVVGEVDPAEATAPSFFQWNSANYLVLRDADGELAQLYWDGTEPASIIDEPGKRAWLIPDDVRTELERYGFDFTPE